MSFAEYLTRQLGGDSIQALLKVRSHESIKAHLIQSISEKRTITGEHDPVFGFAGLMMKAFKDQEFNQALDIVVKHIMELFPN